jgi:hypothetical protein
VLSWSKRSPEYNIALKYPCYTAYALGGTCTPFQLVPKVANDDFMSVFPDSLLAPLAHLSVRKHLLPHRLLQPLPNSLGTMISLVTGPTSVSIATVTSPGPAQTLRQLRRLIFHLDILHLRVDICLHRKGQCSLLGSHLRLLPPLQPRNRLHCLLKLVLPRNKLQLRVLCALEVQYNKPLVLVHLLGLVFVFLLHVPELLLRLV